MTNRGAQSTSNPLSIVLRKFFNKPTRVLEFEAIAQGFPRSVVRLRHSYLTGSALNNRTETPTHELSLPQRSNAGSQRLAFFA
jgi:hypothetical protein